MKRPGWSRRRSAKPAACPLLSHALLETWRRRRGRTLEAYEATGGLLHGALAQTAEELYARLPPPDGPNSPAASCRV
ncbi:nSTAND1 domain-containing NTPase [Streptomyces sp. HUAS TT7]|uniref:nSTAND1 domain-containing NTPase n=1 Tax=Streptomyces sp. HUAS TT7 TaxID=3447507 RepID=UPI003F65DC6F